MRAVALMCAAALVLGSARANAHGAFPQARQLVRDPSSANRLWVRATHGVFRSDDLGQSWSWLCTQAAGYGGNEEPTLAVSSTGQVLAAVFDGIKGSKDEGCTWAAPQPELTGTATGVAVDPANPKRVLALLAHGVGGGSFQNDLWESQDGGETFSPLSSSLEPTALLLSVAVAPSDPKRIYLSGSFSSGSALGGGLLRSDDGGKTWQKKDLGTPAGAAPTLLGVHPTDPGALYLKVQLSDGTAGSPAENALRFSADGGDTSQEVLLLHAPLFAFTFSPGGDSVFVGFGDPQGSVAFKIGDLGLYTASTGSKSFAKVREGHVGCTTFVDGELWACLSQYADGFEIGRSSDGGKSFTGVMQLTDMEPLACEPASSVGQTCQAIWPDVCRDTGKCDPSGSGGAGGADGSSDSGCGCRASERRPAMPALVLGLAALSAAIRRRRR